MALPVVHGTQGDVTLHGCQAKLPPAGLAQLKPELCCAASLATCRQSAPQPPFAQTLP